MFKQTRGIIAGFTAGALTALSLGAVFAAPIERTITALYDDIKIYVDGVLVQARDANGNTVEPFIYEGTTYLPVRAIGEAFDKNVDWDGNTNSVYIGTETKETAEEVKLSEMDYFTKSGNQDFNHKEQERANTGNYYNDCFLYWVGQGVSTRDYLVDGQYKTIDGTIFVEYDSGEYEAIGKFCIWVDNKLIYASEEIRSGFMPKEFNVDITGVSVLKIGFEEIGPNTALVIGVSEVTLRK